MLEKTKIVRVGKASTMHGEKNKRLKVNNDNFPTLGGGEVKQVCVNEVREVGGGVTERSFVSIPDDLS